MTQVEKEEYLINMMRNDDSSINTVFPYGTCIHLTETELIFIDGLILHFKTLPKKHFWNKHKGVFTIQVEELDGLDGSDTPRWEWCQICKKGQNELFALATSIEVKNAIKSEREREAALWDDILVDLKAVEAKYGITFNNWPDWMTNEERNTRYRIVVPRLKYLEDYEENDDTVDGEEQ